MAATVLITGTSAGLGRAAAKLFHGEGWNVVATMRDPAAERELTSLDRVLVTRLGVEDASSEPELIAEQIVAAATSAGNTRRFPAGEDACRTIAAREAATDEQHFASVMERFGLPV